MKKIIYTLKSAVAVICLSMLTTITVNGQINLTQVITPGGFAGEVGWELINTDLNQLIDCRAPGGTGPGTFNYNVPAGNYEVRAYDSFGDGWNNATASYNIGGAPVAGPFTLASGGSSNVCPPAGGVTQGGPVIGTFLLIQPCDLDVPADIVVFNDPGECGAVIDYEVGQGDCVDPFDPQFNDPPSGSFFALGTTEVSVGTGLTAATFTVTVNLQVVCPDDLVIDLQPGLCEQVVTYTVFGQECTGDPEPFSLTQNVGTFPVNDALDCNAAFGVANASHYRAYPALAEDFTVESITVGSWTAGQMNVQIHAYTGPIGGATLDAAAMTPLGDPILLAPTPGGQTLPVLTFPTPVVIPAGTAFVVEQGKEVGAPQFVIASSYSGQTAPSYITDCNNTGTIVQYAALGFPQIHLIQQLNGTVAPPPLDIQQTEGLPSESSFPIGCTTNTFVYFSPEGDELSSCSFDICVNEYSGPEAQNLTCNDMVNISLGFDAEEGCISQIGADDILEGGPYGCYDDYIVTITYPTGIPGISNFPNDFASPDFIDWTHIGLTLTVTVTDPETGNSCWGKIFVEDKQAPLLDCGDELFFPCTSTYDENRDPRGNQIIFPSGLFWGTVNNSPIRVGQFYLNDAINNRRFLVEAGIIDCSEVTLTYSDSEEIYDCDNEDGLYRTVVRTWVAKDIFGNTSSCEQILNFEILTIDEAIEEADITATLNLQPCTPGFQLPDFDFQGACNVWAGIESELRLPLCDGAEHSYKLFRTYLFYDDCTGETRLVDQVIIVMDQIAPVFTDCVNGFLPAREVSTNTFECSAMVTLVPPAVTDNCTEEVELDPSIAGIQLTVVNGVYQAWLPIGGPYTVVWTATDECGNQVQCNELLTVKDTRPPVAVCIQNTVVSLTPDNNQGGGFVEGTARVYASSLDNGSWDNCEIFDFKVMRMSNTTITRCGQTHNTSENPPLGSTFNPLQPNLPYWRDYVEFCCEDLASEDPIMIVLRVRDIYGNVNYCMVNVEVQTKIPPVITCPEPITIECEDIVSEDELRADLLSEARSLALGYGWATVSSICDEEPVVTVNINLNDCGVTEFPSFRVTRTFRVGTGTNQRTCTQEIFVVNSTPFRILNVQPGGIHNRIDDVVWPIDLDLPTCDAAFSVDSLKVLYDETESVFSDFAELGLSTRPRSMPFLRPVTCSVPGMGYDDWEFELEGGCIKIIRRWKIIDWCQIDPETGTYMQWMYDQVIRVLDSAPAEFEEVTISLTNGGVVDDESVNVGCPTDLVTLAHTSEDCTPALSFALLASDDCSKLQNITYSYELTVGSEADDFVPTATVVSGGGNVSATGEFGLNFGDFGPEFQNVVHRIRWVLDDRCGNLSVCEFDFKVIDGKKPSPVCTDEIIAVIMPSSGMISLDASIFNVASTDNCAGGLVYTFNAPFGSPGALEARVFTCDDYIDNLDEDSGESMLTLNMYVTDASGNSDFCIVTLTLQDNDGVCGDISSVIVSGRLTTESESGLNDAEVTVIEGQSSAQQVSTDFEGYYDTRIERMSTNPGDYKVRPEKVDGVLNGVTTLDIVLIQRHMLGTAPLTSPYARIAADVNGDGKINALDIVELRQLVLLKRTGFSGENAGMSWKFVSKAYNFTTGEPEGENYPQEIAIDPTINNTSVDFVAVKLGDVNGNANEKSLDATEDRSGLVNIGMEVNDMELEAGMEYGITFTSSEMNEIEGYQYTLSYGKGLEVVAIEGMNHAMSASNYGIFTDRNIVTMSWNGKSEGSEMYVMYVKATENVRLSDVLSISRSTNHTAAEAYTVGGETRGVELRFNGASSAKAGYALNQNEPNPFKSETKISFNLPSEMKAKVSISDVSGRVLKVYEGTYSAGINNIFVTKSELGAAGVLQYTLETEDFRSTKKMIVIE